MIHFQNRPATPGNQTHCPPRNSRLPFNPADAAATAPVFNLPSGIICPTLRLRNRR